MKSYLDILQKIVDEGVWKQNRTGIKTKSITGNYYCHDMQTGFPAITTRKLAMKTMMVELEGFIKGITAKSWFQERNCKIWNEWCNPSKIPYGNDPETKNKMALEIDLGPIYGYQWRCFNGTYDGPYDGTKPLPIDGIDQLKNIIDLLKKDPTNRRLIVNSWNPCQISQMALPPCHYAFQFLSDGKKLSLSFNMRSWDVVLGGPFNISSYALLLELVAKEVNMVPDQLICFSMDTHIYENQLDILKIQFEREPFQLATLEIRDFKSIYEWSHNTTSLINYKSHPKLDFPLAI